MKLFLIYKTAQIFFVLGLFLSIPLNACAQVVVTETQPLSFGVLTFVSFNDTLSVDILDNGGFNSNANAIVLTPPTRGEFALTGGPANTAYTITFPPSFTISGPGADFTIDNIRTQPAVLVTNSLGEDDFSIAARITSLGGGQIYNNGAYNNTFDIVIAF